MDALYPLGGKQHFAGLELLFSLRMLDKFGEGIKNVFVIGDEPGFLKRPAIPFKEHGVKNFRIAKKIEFACGIKEISNDFLFVNDDHFFTRKFKAAEYPYFQKGQLNKGNKKGGYYEYLTLTSEYLKSINKPTLHYDVHCPIIYNKKKFLELSHIWDEEKEFVVKSMYCNYHGLTGPAYNDNKIKHLINGSDVGRVIENNCFSVFDEAMNRGVIQYLCTNFKEPSRFEKKNIKFKLRPKQPFMDKKIGKIRQERIPFIVNNERAMQLLGKRSDLFSIIKIG